MKTLYCKKTRKRIFIEDDGTIKTPGIKSEIDIKDFTEAVPLPDTRFQKFNGKAWVVDEEKVTAFNNMKEMTAIKKEIAARDYRALKAFKLGAELDDLYPGETKWYQEKITRLHKLEGRE